ncbi:MAG: GNAT family N-acetyltransferase [Saprospiraceae bacterium]
MLQLIRTNSKNERFISLVKLLDQELAERDGAEHGFYATYNGIDQIQHVVLVMENDQAIACGAFKAFEEDSVEIKRMFVLKEVRGKGVAASVLSSLEEWALELGYQKTVLETGKRQPEAIGLYLKNGYRQISNYGQYAGVENSVCFEKKLLIDD